MATDLSPQQALDKLRKKALEPCSRSSATPNLPTQSPFAAVLSCADSRVIPEDIFCAAAGELFVVRTAGNVADVTGIASMEFAVSGLGVPLIVVMGHHNCGAVVAARNYCLIPTPQSPSMQDLIGKIIPALGLPNVAAHTLETQIENNVRETIRVLLEQSKVLREAKTNGSLIFAGAYYTMAGKDRAKNVKWLDNSGINIS